MVFFSVNHACMTRIPSSPEIILLLKHFPTRKEANVFLLSTDSQESIIRSAMHSSKHANGTLQNESFHYMPGHATTLPQIMLL